METRQEEEFNLQDIINDPIAMFEEHIWMTLPRQPRDPSVWTKTEKEKAMLKKLRKYHFPMSHWAAPNTRNGIKYRLTLHLADVKPYPVKTRSGMKVVVKSTVSTMCYPEDVLDIIERYRKNNDVVKYYYNGKTYKA